MTRCTCTECRGADGRCFIAVHAQTITRVMRRRRDEGARRDTIATALDRAVVMMAAQAHGVDTSNDLTRHFSEIGLTDEPTYKFTRGSDASSDDDIEARRTNMIVECMAAIFSFALTTAPIESLEALVCALADHLSDDGAFAATTDLVLNELREYREALCDRRELLRRFRLSRRIAMPRQYARVWLGTFAQARSRRDCIVVYTEILKRQKQKAQFERFADTCVSERLDRRVRTRGIEKLGPTRLACAGDADVECASHVASSVSATARRPPTFPAVH